MFFYFYFFDILNLSFFLIKFCKLEKSRNFLYLSSIYLYRDGSDIPKNYFIHLDILIFLLSMGVAFVNIWAFISISILFYVFFFHLSFNILFAISIQDFCHVCFCYRDFFFFYCVCVLGLLSHFYVYILISLMDLCICFFYYLSWHLVCWCYVVF